MSIHSVGRSQNHLAWDNSIPPVQTIASGDTVTFDCLDASNGQITSTSTSDTVRNLDFSQLDQVCGPIAVEGAEPGDTLRVDVLTIETADWGWTALIPGFGLLADEFTDPELKVWNIDKDSGQASVIGEEGFKTPIRPFAGEMGLARGVSGAFSTIPPYNTGGNIDTKHVTAGSTLYLPVEAPGALFSIGDGHAAQGDGEVCGTAIETPITVTVRLTVIKDKSYVKTPHFRTHIAQLDKSSADGDEYYCTTGVGPDIHEAARDAVRHMIAFLVAEHGFDRVTAYMLCSVAGDLRMHEVVDMPNYVASILCLYLLLARSFYRITDRNDDAQIRFNEMKQERYKNSGIVVELLEVILGEIRRIIGGEYWDESEGTRKNQRVPVKVKGARKHGGKHWKGQG